MKVDNQRLNELVTQLKKGEMSAFDEFYEMTKRLVYFNIYQILMTGEDSEDVLQETYIHFLNSLSSLDPSHSPLGYLLTVSRNLSLNFLKSRNRKRAFNEGEEGNIASVDKAPPGEDKLILEIQSLLKPKEFRIVYLKIIDDYTHQEIADLLGKPLGTITWAYNNAIKKLQKGLKKTYGKQF